MSAQQPPTSWLFEEGASKVANKPSEVVNWAMNSEPREYENRGQLLTFEHWNIRTWSNGKYTGSESLQSDCIEHVLDFILLHQFTAFTLLILGNDKILFTYTHTILKPFYSINHNIYSALFCWSAQIIQL